MSPNNKKENLAKSNIRRAPRFPYPKSRPQVSLFQGHTPRPCILYTQQRQKPEFANHIYSPSLVSLSSNWINHTCSLIPNQEALESDSRDVFYGSSCVRYENEKCLTHPAKMCIRSKSKWSGNEMRLDSRWQSVKRKTWCHEGREEGSHRRLT